MQVTCIIIIVVVVVLVLVLVVLVVVVVSFSNKLIALQFQVASFQSDRAMNSRRRVRRRYWRGVLRHILKTHAVRTRKGSYTRRRCNAASADVFVFGGVNAAHLQGAITVTRS